MSWRGPLRGECSRIVWRTVKRHWPLVLEWIRHGANTGSDNPLMRELLREAGCWGNYTRRNHAKARFRELSELDAIMLLGLVERIARS